jgi:choline-sulfatase
MTQPNVLWICTDQQRFDSLGCYGNEFVDTPNIDRLAERGVQFDQAFCQSPVCAPSRASFLTGRYPRTTGVRQNGQQISDNETLVTKSLADDGYTCGLAGKLHISPCNPHAEHRPMTETRIDDGYSEFHWSHDPNRTWPTNEYRQWLRERGAEYDPTPHPDSEYVETDEDPDTFQTTWCAQKAINFVEEAADFEQPWLYSVNFFDPHHPFAAPEEYLERYEAMLEDIPLPEYEDGELDDKPDFHRDYHEGAYRNPDLFPFADMDETDHRLLRAAYWAMVDLVDDQVGRLLDALERTGQREDTLVIFMSDHGELLGDNGAYLKGPFFYEQSVRVPLIASMPGEIREGATSDALVELVDLAPTLLDAAGVDREPGMQGESLWPMLTGESDLDEHRDAVYAECYNAPGAIWDDTRQYVTMVRTDRYKLAKLHGEDTGELYDLEADPTETENLWNDPEYADRKADLLSRLTDQMAWTMDPLPEREAPF